MSVFKHALMITSFVFCMMLVIEYLNVFTRGDWQHRLASRKWGQYLLAAALGATPGCLGAFMVVAMYSHRIVSIGAVVTVMIATSGDEAFVMLAMIPKQALLVFAILFVISITAGAITDLIVSKRARHAQIDEVLEVHEEEYCNCYPKGQILNQWRKCIPGRGILGFVLALFFILLVFGEIGPSAWNWIRTTLLIVSATTIFIVCTVPDHFIENHLWEHIVLKHVPQIFLWTFGTLLTIHFLTEHLALDQAIRESRWIVLLVACLVGLIPESGPHLVFVTLYSQGTIPMSILLASSIVQDGHGMLPLLAGHKKEFILIKVINLLVGLMIGSAVMSLGF